MKRLIMCICVILSLSFLSTVAFASNLKNIEPGIKSGVDKKFFNEENSRMPFIEESLQESYGKAENDENAYKNLSLRLELSYKIYQTNSVNIVEGYLKNNNFGDIISENYFLQVPLINKNNVIKSILTYKTGSNGLELVSFGKRNLKEFETLTERDKIIEKVKKIGNLNEEDIKDIKALYLDRYYICMLYLKTVSDEYIIPITSEFKDIEIKENKLYTANEFINIIQKTHLEDLNANEDYNAGVGINKTKKINDNNASNIYMYVALTVIIAVAVVLIRRYKNKGITQP